MIFDCFKKMILSIRKLETLVLAYHGDPAVSVTPNFSLPFSQLYPSTGPHLFFPDLCLLINASVMINYAQYSQDHPFKAYLLPSCSKTFSGFQGRFSTLLHSNTYIVLAVCLMLFQVHSIYYSSYHPCKVGKNIFPISQLRKQLIHFSNKIYTQALWLQGSISLFLFLLLPNISPFSDLTNCFSAFGFLLIIFLVATIPFCYIFLSIAIKIHLKCYHFHEAHPHTSSLNTSNYYNTVSCTILICTCISKMTTLEGVEAFLIQCTPSALLLLLTQEDWQAIVIMEIR